MRLRRRADELHQRNRCANENTLQQPEGKHTSKSGNATGGSIDNVVPECGSMVMGDIQWKKLKGLLQPSRCAARSET